MLVANLDAALLDGYPCVLQTTATLGGAEEVDDLNLPTSSGDRSDGVGLGIFCPTCLLVFL